MIDRAAMAAAGIRGRLRWLDPEERDRARRAMDAVAGPAPVLDRLALRHLARHEQRERFIARPAARTGRMPVEGAEHLRAAYAEGRGVVTSFCHLGLFLGAAITVAGQTGAQVHPVAGTWLAQQSAAGLTPRARRWRDAYEAAGIRFVDAEASFDRLCGLLADGHIVTMAFDWPGTTATRFLGRPVAMASGTARLAHETGALVVPLRRTVRRCAARATFGPVVDPRDHDDWGSIHRDLAAVHERWILEDPAALEDPRRPGCWGSAATSAGWPAVGRVPDRSPAAWRPGERLHAGSPG